MCNARFATAGHLMRGAGNRMPLHDAPMVFALRDRVGLVRGLAVAITFAPAP